MASELNFKEIPIFKRCEWEECRHDAEIECGCCKPRELFCQYHYNLHTKKCGRSNFSFDYVHKDLSESESESITHAKEILKTSLQSYLDKEKKITNKRIKYIKLMMNEILKESASRTKQQMQNYKEQMSVLQTIQNRKKLPRISESNLARNMYNMAAIEALTRENLETLFQFPDDEDIVEDFKINIRCLKLLKTTKLSEKAITEQEKNYIAENADVGILQFLNKINLSSLRENLLGLVQIVRYKFETWELQAALSGHSSSVFAVAMSPDSNLIASGSNKQVRLWNFTSEEPQGQFKVPGQVTSLNFSPCSKYVAVGSSNPGLLKFSSSGIVIVIDTHSGTSYQIEGHKSIISSVKYTPCGRYLLTASHDCTIKLWNLNTRGVEFTFKGHTGRIFSISVSECGTYMVSGGWDRDLFLWNLPSRQHQLTLTQYEKIGRINCVDFASRGKPLIVAASETCNDGEFFNPQGFVSIWNYQTGELEKKFITSIVRLALFSPCAEYIAVLCIKGKLFVIRMCDKNKSYVERKSDKIECITYSSCGKYIVSGCEKSTVQIWKNS